LIAGVVSAPASSSNITFAAPSGGYVSRFDASGNFTTIGNVTSFGSISDQRFKSDVADLDGESVVDTLNRLRPVSFKWNEDIAYTDKAGTSDWGLIAQEVRDVVPGMVDIVPSAKDHSEMMVVRYEKLIPYLLKAVQHLHQLIKA
jgi:hypothetical protein